MLEDSAEDVHLIEKVLRRSKLNFNSLNVDTRDAYVKAIDRFKPDIVLSDHALPGFNSQEALRLSREILPEIPFILVSGMASDEFTAACLREGADDYISKTNLVELPAAIRQVLKKRKTEQQKRDEILALRRKNRELVNINQALDNFTYTISHHLRGPITTAMGLLNLARQTHEVKDIHELHGLMHNSLNRLDELLKALLECSRNAHREVKKEHINWDEIVKAAFARVDHLDEQQTITRLVNLDADVPVYSDSLRLTFMLGTLLNNAFTYRNRTRGYETIVSVDIVTSASSVSITVRDNGVGIQAEALPKVFDLFYRGTDYGQGSGVGLYLVKGIVTSLSGTIDINSTEGVGTTVLVEIPNVKID